VKTGELVPVTRGTDLYHAVEAMTDAAVVGRIGVKPTV
jgi:hypothetical protein